MRILVVGASQGTGARAVQVALDRGHEVTAFARSPQRLAIEHPKLTKRVGDFHDQASVAAAVPGHDAVIITASATKLSAFKSEPQYFSKGTGFVIEAMRRAGIQRLVIMSANGTGESRKTLPWLLQKIAVDWLLKASFADHAVQEQQARDSGLEWVVGRPGRLSNRPGRGNYQAKGQLEPVPGSIARADVADFLVNAAETDQWLRQAVQLGG